MSSEPGWNDALPGDDPDVPFSEDEMREVLTAMLCQKRLPGLLHLAGEVMMGMSKDAAADMEAAASDPEITHGEVARIVATREVAAQVLRAGQAIADLLDGTALAVATVEHKLSHATGVIPPRTSKDDPHHEECVALKDLTEAFLEEHRGRADSPFGQMMCDATDDIEPRGVPVDLNDMRQIIAAHDGLQAFYEKMGVTQEMLEDDKNIIVGPLHADTEIMPGMTVMQLMARMVESGQGRLERIEQEEDTADTPEALRAILDEKLNAVIEKARAEGKDVHVVNLTDEMMREVLAEQQAAREDQAAADAPPAPESPEAP